MLKEIMRPFGSKSAGSKTAGRDGNEIPVTQQQQQGGEGYSPRGYDDIENSSEMAEDNRNRREQVRESPRLVATPVAPASPYRNDGVTQGAGKKNTIRTEPKKNIPLTSAVKIASGFFSGVNSKLIFFLFFVLSFVNWFFMILATTLSQLDAVGGACYTYWGYKSNCDTVSYTRRTQLLPCSKLRKRLQAGAAFSIFAILLMSVLLFFIMKALMIYRWESQRRKTIANTYSNGEGVNQQKPLPMVHYPLKWYIIGISATALVCELICWGMTASIYVSRFCEDPQAPRSLVYGVGFGLLLVAWIAEIIILLLFVFVI